MRSRPQALRSVARLALAIAALASPLLLTHAAAPNPETASEAEVPPAAAGTQPGAGGVLATAATPAPPTNVHAEDKPSDEGRNILLTWTLSADDGAGAKSVVGYELLRATSATGPFEDTGTAAAAGESAASDRVPADGTDYWYVVRALTTGPSSDSVPFGPVRSSPQWFKKPLTIVAVSTFLFCAVCLFVLGRAGRGAQLYIRPISGIHAIDEAIGRATEMGKPILFVPGLFEANDVPTIAALSILARVAKKVADYQSRIIVPCYYPMVMVVAQEVVKNAYLLAGRPDSYNEKDVFFVTQEQFAYTAAINGIMLRDRPATNFYLGAFFAESLILAETGFQAGSIQIAGTDQLIQIPFFVAACDYTLIGEELYAAAAYLSDDPKQKATLKAQDYGKAAVLAIIAAGAVFASFGLTWFTRLFEINF